jgi:hypothetical protein
VGAKSAKTAEWGALGWGAVRKDLPPVTCQQCGQPIFEAGSPHRVVYAISAEEPEERDTEQEAPTVGLVHTDCWPQYVESHGE